MTKFRDNQVEKLDEYRELEAENKKRDTELRKMIKEEKVQHREISKSRRANSKDDKKIFSSFVNAHD